MAVALLFAVAPAASAGLIGDVTGGVGDALDGGGGGSESSGSESDPSSGSDGGGLGDALGGLTDALDGDEEGSSEPSENPVKKIVGGVSKVFDDTTTELEEAVSDPGGYVGGVTEKVDKTVKKTKRSLKDKRTGKDTGDRSSSASLPSLSPADVFGSHLAAARATDPTKLVLRDPTTDDSPTIEASTPGVFAAIGRVAVEAAEQVAFPLALALLVGTFLMVQNRIDRRDPKLALAPIHSDHELLTFS
jgi:hypothetical protein